MPWLEEVIGDIGDAIRNWAGDADESEIEGFVRRVRRSFNIWMGIVKELWGIVKAFFGDANDAGDELAEHDPQDPARLPQLARGEPGRDQATSSRTPPTSASDLADVAGRRSSTPQVDHRRQGRHQRASWARSLPTGQALDRGRSSGRRLLGLSWPFARPAALIPGVGTRRHRPGHARARRVRDPPVRRAGDRRPPAEPAQRRQPRRPRHEPRRRRDIENINLPPAPGHASSATPATKPSSSPANSAAAASTALAGGGIR